MKRNSYIALAIAAAVLLVIFAVIILADKQFEQSDRGISMGIEFKSDKIEQLEKEKNQIIEEYAATNADLIKASVLNHRLQERSDSLQAVQDKIINRQKIQIRNKDEENDSLRAVIRSIRQSDI